MKYTVNYMCREAQHTNGLYEDFAHAKEIAASLVKTEADAAWVELTEYPELRTPPFLKEKPAPKPVVEKAKVKK